MNRNPDQPSYSTLPALDGVAASQYVASTPNLLRWFDRYNEGKPYRDQVKPFNFLLAYQAERLFDFGWDAPEPNGKTASPRKPWRYLPRAVAPFNRDPAAGAKWCFDRDTGDPIPLPHLKTYRRALANYHLRSETKFSNGDWRDRGETRRRHVAATGIRYIGKETNRWEEQFSLGLDPEAQPEYGLDPQSRSILSNEIDQAAKQFGQRRLADQAGISRQQLAEIITGRATPKAETLLKIAAAARALKKRESERRAAVAGLISLAKVEIQQVGLRAFARENGIDPSNLANMLAGRRKISDDLIAKLQGALARRI